MAQGVGAWGATSDALLRNVAFLQKVILRAKPFQSVDARASRFLRLLSQPSTSLAFRLSLEELRFHSDLIDETSALQPHARKLQVRIVELAKDYPAAEKMTLEMRAKGGIAILVLGIVVHGELSGTHMMRFEFPKDQDGRIRHLVHTPIGWTEVLTMPAKLSDPIRGFLMRIDAIGYENVRPYVRFKESQATQLKVDWTVENTVDIEVI